MQKIRALIKGTQEQVQQELEVRGIQAEFVQTTEAAQPGAYSNPSTYWDIRSHYLPKVISWHCEPGVCHAGTGFPVGTLLHYSY